MTGFGRSEKINEKRKVIVEMKSVNHRYCDMTIKMPKKLNAFEAAIRNFLKDYIQRGKVDVFITYEEYTEQNVAVKYNKDIAAEYMTYFREMQKDFGLIDSISPSVLGRMPDVFSIEELPVNEDEIFGYLKEALAECGERFVESRIVEGDNLKKDLIAKLDNMASLVKNIEDISPELIAEYKKKLTDKVNDLLGNTQLDETRIAMEVTIYADKICVDEEIVRLKSHIEAVKGILNEGGSVGRKLDFIIQEMNREANTILSKAGSLAVTDTGIELKTEIEKIREQIQNIE